MFREGFLKASFILFVGHVAFAAGPILNSVDQISSASHFKVKYHFSNNIDLKNVETELINNTVQVNVKGAQLEQDKRFDKLTDPMVKNLYSFMTEKDKLALRINYKSKYNAQKFDGRLSFEVKGKDLFVSVADGRAIVLGTLDNILEKPSNLNAQQIEDKYKYLQQKLSDDELEEQENVRIDMPKVINVNNFDSEMASSLKFDNSDSIKDDLPKLKENQGPIKVKTIKNLRNTASDESKVLIEEDLSKSESSEPSELDKAKLNENEIPVFTKGKKTTEIKNEAPSGGLWMGLLIFAGMVLVSIMGIRRYTNKKVNENKHTSIKVLTQHHLGPKKSLAIIRVAGESILIGLTDTNISLIKSLHLLDEDLPEDNLQPQKSNFLGSLKREEKVQEQSFGMAGADFYEEEEEEFSVRGLKDLVKNKLSGMKEL